MRKILITGGAGFVGYHLAELLSREGDTIVIADNFFRARKDTDLEALLAKPNARLIEGDLTERSAWSALGTGYDEVYHLASINGTKLFYEMPQEVLRIGILSSLYGLDWFRNENATDGAKILYTSSNEAYAGALEAFGTLPIPTPENVPLVIADTYNPRWSYAGQKLIGEQLFIHYAKAYGFRMSIVRPHNFYGPRAGYAHVIPEVIGRIVAKEQPFTVFGANETRSFCYIDDAVAAIRDVMRTQKTDNGTYHIGSTEEIRIGQLVEEMFSIMNWSPTDRIVKESPAGSVKRRLADVSKIQRDCGWRASTPLRSGLAKTIAWYVQNQRPSIS